jgi:hypothetical protein
LPDEGTTCIMDDVLLFSVNNEHAFIIATCVCMIVAKYHITWKLKKAQWFPRSIEVVGVDLHKAGGNTPARSKTRYYNELETTSNFERIHILHGFHYLLSEMDAVV